MALADNGTIKHHAALHRMRWGVVEEELVVGVGVEMSRTGDDLIAVCCNYVPALLHSLVA